MQNNTPMRIRKDAFRNKIDTVLISEGLTLEEALRDAFIRESIPTSLLKNTIVHIDGVRIPRDKWNSFVVKKEQFVSVSIPLLGGGGSKNPLRTILQLVVVAVAAAATWYIGGKGALAVGGWFTAGSASAYALAAVASSAVYMGGMALVDTIAPAAQPKLSLPEAQEAGKRLWSIEGTRNSFNPYGVIPIVLGKIRYAPPLGAKSYSTYDQNDQYVHFLYEVCGECTVSDFRIGNTDIAEYEGVEINTYENWEGAPFEFFNKKVEEESYGIQLKKSDGWVTRTTEIDTTRVGILLGFNGLKVIDKKGRSYPTSVTLELRYKKTGSDDEWTTLPSSISTNGGTVLSNSATSFTIGINVYGSLVFNGGYPILRCTGSLSWKFYYDSDGRPSRYRVYTPGTITPINGFTGTGSWSDGGVRVSVTSGSRDIPSLVFSGQTVTAQRRSIYFDVPKGQYDVSIRRITADANKETTESTTLNDSSWQAMQSWSDKHAVIYRGTPMTIIEMRIKASEQLSGSLDTFNALFYSQAPVPSVDDEGNVNWTWQNTSNPASLALGVALSKNIGNPAKIEDMDLESYKGFYDWCESMGWKYNEVLTSEAQTGDVIKTIMSAGRGSYSFLDGHGVSWDDPEKPVVEVFSPRNSWGFEATQGNMVREVHALRVMFLNEEKDYQEDEYIVFADGYDESNSENYIDWEQPGVTNADLIYKHARLRLASMKMQRVVYTFNCEAESLCLVRGDVVRVTHDTSFWGLGSAYIRKVYYDTETEEDATRVTGFDVDDEFPFAADGQYGIRVTGGALLDKFFSVLNQGEGLTRHIELASPIPIASAPDFGYMVNFGPVKSIGAKLTVIGITPAEDLTAQVTLIDTAPEKYEAITGDIPAFDSQITIPNRYQSGMPLQPVILNVVSDETVLVRLDDGSLSPRIVITYEIQDGSIDTEVAVLRIRDKNDGEPWRTITQRTDDKTFVVDSVDEGATYEFTVTLQSYAGVMSNPSELQYVLVIGKTSLPDNVEGFAAAISSPDGVLLSWTELDVKDLSHYEIGGAYTGTAIKSPIVAQVPSKIGETTFSIVAVDTGGRRSLTPTTASVVIERPSSPVMEMEPRTDGLYLIWDDAETTWPIRHYVVKDMYTNKSHKALTEQLVVSSRPSGTYSFSIQAVDIFNNVDAVWSQDSVSTFDFVISNPSAPVVAASIYGNALRISWKEVSSSFPVAKYQVYTAEGALLDEVSTTYYDILNPSGTVNVKVRAVDTAGNASEYDEVQYVVDAPNAPYVNVVVSDDKTQIVASWGGAKTDLPISGYDLVRQWDDSDGVTHEESYGRIDVDNAFLPPVEYGTHTFMVRAIDSAGVKSGWGFTEFSVVLPSAPRMLSAEPIRNVVQLSWIAPQTSTFAVSHYVISLIDGEYSMELGEVDALFAIRNEEQAGTYIYGISPVDVAGNRGAMAQISAAMSSPQGFVLWSDKDSLFNGTLTNAVLDGVGGMLLPVVVDETWQANITRSATDDVSSSDLTWQNKIDADALGWLSPSATTGSYVEVVDVGTVIPATQITVTITKEAIDGNPQVSCKIEVSEDNVEWIVLAENSFTGYAVSFRYVRYSFTVSGGMTRITEINYKLSITQITDFGTADTLATDGGTGTETGTYVPFRVPFTDVQTITVTINDANKIALYNFDDVLNPQGFRVYALDSSSGERVDGIINWSAYGV